LLKITFYETIQIFGRELQHLIFTNYYRTSYSFLFTLINIKIIKKVFDRMSLNFLRNNAFYYYDGHESEESKEGNICKSQNA